MPLVIYDFAPDPFWISLYENLVFFFYQCTVSLPFFSLSQPFSLSHSLQLYIITGNYHKKIKMSSNGPVYLSLGNLVSAWGGGEGEEVGGWVGGAGIGLTSPLGLIYKAPVYHILYLGLCAILSTSIMKIISCCSAML
jgi:hypothetical protein